MKQITVFAWTLMTVLLLSACHKSVITNGSGNKSPITIAKSNSANCYIVPPGRSLIFPAVEGNTKNDLTMAREATVLWETDNTAKAVKKGAVVKKISYADGRVTLETGVQGNALVAVEDGDGLILWSWHIWVTKYSPDSNTIPLKKLVNSSSGTFLVYEMMDRNLGALTAKADDPLSLGLQYFPNRKDPFPGLAGFHEAFTSEEGGTVRAAVSGSLPLDLVNASDIEGNLEDYLKKNPGTIVNYYEVKSGKTLWSETSKTVNDPCPHGYRVAVATAWKIITDHSADAIHTVKYADWNEVSGWESLAIPQCGYGSASRSYLSCIQSPSSSKSGLHYSAYMLAPPDATPGYTVWLRYNDGTGSSTENSSIYVAYAGYLPSGAVRCMKE